LWNAFPNVFGPFENTIKQAFDTLKSQGLDIFLLVLCHDVMRFGAILEASRRHRLWAWMWAQRILLLPSAQMVDLW